MPSPARRTHVPSHALRACAVALLLASACGVPGPDADRTKSPDQIASEAREHDRPELERIIDGYERRIRSREGELRELEQDVRAKAGGVIDAVFGTGPNDGVRAELEKLRTSATALGAELRSLHERLGIYTRELRRRP